MVKYLYKKCNRYLFAILSHCDTKDGWVQGLCANMLEELELSPSTKLDYKTYADKYDKNLLELSEKIANEVFNAVKPKKSPSEFFKAIQAVDVIDLDSPTVRSVSADSSSLDKAVGLWNEYAQLYKEQKIAFINSCQEICGVAAYALEELLKRNADQIVKGLKTYLLIFKKYVNIYSAMRESFLANGVAPVVQFNTSFFDMYKTSDSDISALFKFMYLRYRTLSYDKLAASERCVGSEEEFTQFKKALEEFNTRQYRQSLWKSEYEYRLFIERIQKKTALPFDAIHEELIALIEKGTPEEFEDPKAFKSDQKNLVYGNTGKPHKDFSKVFGIFGKGLVIKVYTIKYKDFGKLEIKFADSKKSYEELDFTKKAAVNFPYLYYVEKGDGGEQPYSALTSTYNREDLMQQLENEFVNFLRKKYGGTGDGKMATNYTKNGKIIRDSVHGDIFVPQRFLSLIDTKAFQRLRRIKQLAVADRVFPEATHTRFAHSLGVFHIMNMMLEHFCDFFDLLNIPYSQTDKDAILAAALLHDIGHGPYSHAFEKALGKSHEDWTIELILNDEELNNAITKSFGTEFPKHIISYLNYSKNKLTSDNGEFSLGSVFSTLINSQLDADRLDYLLRDAYNTGVKLGSIDLQKIISSLELTKYNGNICVCINEDALPNIEQMILARYNMYDRVYNSPHKIYTEELLDKIIKRIFSNNEALQKSPLLCRLCEAKRTDSFCLEDYMKLDDYRLYEEIHNCLTANDPVLTKMVSAFYDRTEYTRIRILDEAAASVEEFFAELKVKFSLDEDCAGIIRATKSYYAYSTAGNQHILILKRNGTVSDITRESRIFASSSQKRLWLTITDGVYISYDILKDEIQKIDLDALKAFIASYDIRRHIEIEEKYHCRKEDLQAARAYLDDHSEVLLNNRRYKIEKCKVKAHKDEYYDTPDKLCRLFIVTHIKF